MTKKFREIIKGLQLENQSTTIDYDSATEGGLYNHNDESVRVHIEGEDREVLTDTQEQTVTNKTIDGTSATGTNTITADSDNVSYDNTASGLAATDVKSAIDELESAIEGQDEASEISFDPSTSTLTSTNVQDAIDEEDAKVETNTENISENYNNIMSNSDWAIYNYELITDHISDTTDAHTASALTNVPSGNLDATDVQSALNELQDDIDNSISIDDLNAHIADTTTHGTIGDIVGTTDTQTLTDKTIDADLSTITNIGDDELKAGIDSAKIGTGVVSNTEFAYLDGVTSAIQTQIDAKTDDTTVDAHILDTVTHGTAGDIVGTSDSQVITNKDIDGSTATDTSRITLPKAGTTALAALTNKEATLAYDTDLETLVVNDGTEWTEISGSGGGGGGLDTFYTESFEETEIGDITSGNNATFLGGGTIVGTLAYETTNPISGDQSLSFTQASGSLNDYVALPVITLDDKQKGNEAGFTHYFTYDGDETDIKLVIWDVTNSVELTNSSSSYYETKSNATRYTANVYIPTDCDSIRIGYQVVTENIGAVLVVDDYEGSTNPFVYKNLLETQSYSLEQAGTSMTDRSGETEFDLDTATIDNSGSSIVVATDDSTNTRTKFIASRDCIVNISWNSAVTNIGVGVTIYKNGVRIQQGDTIPTGSYRSFTSADFDLEEGEYFTVGVNGSFVEPSADIAYLTFTAIAETEAVVHADSATENDFSAVIPSSGTTITSEGASAISSFSWATNVVTMNLNSDQFSVAPKVDIFPEPTSYTVSSTTITATFSSAVEFNIGISSQGVDYKNTNAYAVTPLTRTAIIEYNTSLDRTDIATEGNSVTIPLNEIVNNQSFASLSSNQITIPSGKYLIDYNGYAYSPSNSEFEALLEIYNVTTSTVISDGTVCAGESTSPIRLFSSSVGTCELEVTESTTLELRGHSIVVVASGYWGQTYLDRGKVKATVKITKLL